MSKCVVALLTLLVSLVGSGCAALLGDLRKDFYDPEMVGRGGGSWPEAAMIDDSDLEIGSAYDSDYMSVGHGERGPASHRYNPGIDRPSWVTPMDAESSGRDRYRVPSGSYSSNPNMAPAEKRDYRDSAGGRVTRGDFVDSSDQNGSLWASNGQTNYLFTKNRVREMGDIISVTVSKQLVHDVGLEIKSQLTEQERETELAAAQKRKLDEQMKGSETGGKINKGEIKQKSAPSVEEGSDDGDEPVENTIEPPVVTDEDIEVTTSVDVKEGDPVMMEIVDRYENGNYKLRGTKRITYRGSVRMLTLIGVAKSADIEDADTLDSTKLYEYRLKVYQ